MDILCIHSDEKIRKTIKKELDYLEFENKCFSGVEEAEGTNANVALIEFKKDQEDLIKRYPLVIPLIRTADSDLTYRLDKMGVEYITVDPIGNFRQKLMKIMLNNRDKIGEISDKDNFLRNIIYAYGFSWGKMYTVNIGDSIKIYSFLETVSDSIPVFLVSRERPDTIVRRENMRVIWVTDILGKNRIRPHNLTMLTDLISRFLEGGEKRIVVMNCIEYLLLYNDIISILRNLELINSYAMEYNSLIILIIDENAYSKRDISLLRRYTIQWNGGG